MNIKKLFSLMEMSGIALFISKSKSKSGKKNEK